MTWIRKSWWLAPVVLIVAFNVWAALAQLGVGGDDAYDPGTDVDLIAASVWLGFALAAGAGLVLRDRRHRESGCLIIVGSLPALAFVWFPPSVLVGLACIASGVFVLASATPDGIPAA